MVGEVRRQFKERTWSITQVKVTRIDQGRGFGRVVGKNGQGESWEEGLV